MIKLASFALVAVVGVAASLPAAARPVEIVYRGAEFVRPAGYFPEYYRPYYGYDRYWHRDHWRDARFHHEWDRR
jgi:hypothetical protein